MQRRTNEIQKNGTVEDDATVSEDDDSTALENNSGLKCIRDDVDPSLIGASLGRRSYQGFNQAIESMWAHVDRQNKYTAAEERELREEVSAEEMTRRMQKYVGLKRKTCTGRKKQHSLKN